MRPLTQAADFERVLAAPSRARSPHFAIHHLPAVPAVSRRARRAAAVPELSTANAPERSECVDNSEEVAPEPGLFWLGTVVPKRHAKRAVTRALLKRQMRSAVARHASCLAGGLWVLRLRRPFDRQQFSSAASDALRAAVRQELESVLLRAAR